MTHALTLPNKYTTRSEPRPYIQPLDLDRIQFINRYVFANSYHHEIGIPIHEIYTWKHIPSLDLYMQPYTSISSNKINFL